MDVDETASPLKSAAKKFSGVKVDSEHAPGRWANGLAALGMAVST